MNFEEENLFKFRNFFKILLIFEMDFAKNRQKLGILFNVTPVVALQEFEILNLIVLQRKFGISMKMWISSPLSPLFQGF